MTAPPGEAAGVRHSMKGELGSLQIRLLGGFEVSFGPRRIGAGEWRLRRTATLVKLLALAPGHRLHRDVVADTLWPDADGDTAANRLHHTLHVTRRTIDPSAHGVAGIVRLDGETLYLGAPEGVWVDVVAFERAAATARRGEDAGAYRAAIDLYGGDLLPDDLYEDWAAPRRESLRAEYLDLLATLARLHEGRGELGAAIETLRRTVAHEPAHEDAHVALMRLYARTGQRNAALRQYEQLRLALRRELDAEPDDVAQRLRDQILAGAVPSSPSPRPEPAEQTFAPGHNLPAALSSFVGREAEMAEAERLLQTTRLLSITGPGGAGKTRFAVEVAGRLLGEYVDGVRMAELAPIAEEELVPQVVAAALGVQERADREILASIAEELREKQILLVLDNCEHLVDACARVAEFLLSACPRLRILATSREVLGVPGEVTALLPPLSLIEPPAAGAPPALDELLKSDAIRLFVDRARGRNPDFALTAENGPAVADICRRLEGIPLAIELAAARVGSLSVGQIARRLEDCLSLLTTGGRTREPRQQTLRGALDWSYDLLSEGEQALFRSLSVFAGGWTLEAAETIGTPGETLDLLSRLVDRSLVVTEEADGAVRYRLLEPVRQYAHARLVESGEAETVHRRHAALFLAFAERADSGLRDPEQGAWLRRFETEHDNLRAALEWARSNEGDAGLGLRLAAHAWMFWYSHGHLREGREWLETLLARTAPIPSEERTMAVRGLGIMFYAQREYARAAPIITQALDMARALGNEPLAARLIGNLASVITEQGDIERARELHEEALALHRALSDELGMTASLCNLGTLAYRRGEYEQACAYFEEGLAIDRRSGDVGSAVIALTNLGSTAMTMGDVQRAVAYFTEVLPLVRELGDREVISASLGGMAEAAHALGRSDRAARLHGAAEAVRRAIGQAQHPDDQAQFERHLAEVRAAAGDAFEQLWAEGMAMGIDEAITYALSADQPPAQTPEGEPAEDRSRRLSRREREVATLVARGLTNRQIAAELSIAERTADTHVSNILGKLGLASRAQLATWMTEQGHTE